jgi:hypothetical protein
VKLSVEQRLRIAARVVARSCDYFQPGDLIVYGKYKNKPGKVVRIFKDEKGYPAIEVEPVPKGRKQNKTFSLFKMRHMPEGTRERLKAKGHLE